MTYHFETSGKLRPYTAEELLAMDETSPVIVLDQGVLDNGSPYWMYIAVKSSKYEEFMQLTQAHEKMRFQEYGEVLEFGFSHHVPVDIKAKMRSEHGCDDDFMKRAESEFKAAQAAYMKQQEASRIDGIVAMLKQQAS